MNGHMSGQDIYESFANSDMRVLDGCADAAKELSGNYHSRSYALGGLITAMEQAWQGRAADLSRRGASPLAIGHLVAAPQIGNAATSMQQQFLAFAAAKNSVVPVPPIPETPGFFDNVFSLGNAGREYEKKMAAVQTANEHNIAVMTQYENATQQNQALLTEIKPREEWRQLFQTPQPQSPPTPYAVPSQIRSSGDIGPSGSGGQPHAGTTTTASSQPHSRPSTPPTVSTELGQTHPGSAQTPPQRVSLSDVDKPTRTPLNEGPKPGLFGPVGGGNPRSGADPRGGAPGGSRGYGAGKPGEPGARGPAGAEGPVGRTAAGRAGGPASGAPLGTARRNQESEDPEHQRPAFLVEADPDEIFGADGVTAPPVIGA